MRGDVRRRLRLSEIKSRLERAGLDWAIFAGAAVACYGSSREITDIDILVRCEDLEKARAALRQVDIEGFDVGCGAEITTDEGEYPFFLDDEMVQRISWRELFGVNVPVMSVEDNIVLKAILQRGKEQGKHDVEDTKSMVNHENVGVKYLEKRMRICGAEKRVKPLLKSIIPIAQHTRKKPNSKLKDQTRGREMGGYR
jgi:nitrogen regulatory protein PII